MKNYFSFFQGQPGYWSRGKFFPAIMGGSDAGAGGDAGGANAAATAMLQAGTEGAGSSTGSGSGGQGSNDNSFHSEVLGSLEGVSDAERPILEKYLKGIDAQVQNRFNSIHEQYAPFKDMDPESVQQAMGVASMIESDPMRVLRTIGDALGYDFEGLEGDGEYEGDEEGEYEDDEDGGEFAELPSAFMEQFNGMQEIVEALAEVVLDTQRSSQESAEDAELEEELEALHDEYGDFDEEFVLSYAAANNSDLESALAYYNSFVEKIRGEGNGQAPPGVRGGPVLQGGGIPSTESVDVKQLDNKQTKNLVAQLIAASSQE